MDVEADGPIPSDYAMVCFGGIVVDPSRDRQNILCSVP
jgi:hypothetical protein